MLRCWRWTSRDVVFSHNTVGLVLLATFLVDILSFGAYGLDLINERYLRFSFFPSTPLYNLSESLTGNRFMIAPVLVLFAVWVLRRINGTIDQRGTVIFSAGLVLHSLLSAYLVRILYL